MAEITKLNIAELDFDTIKTNLKDYFGSQSEFTDHNFDGSAISVLLDILAYNTHYNAYYLNMLASESFLDSAQLRDSVVAKASMLGYTPRSVRGSQAYVDITITPGDSPASITVDKDTQFTSTVNGTSYTFATANSTVITPVGGNYVAENVLLRQGVPLTFKYTVDTANTEQKFLLPNANTDTNTLVVSVQESATDTNTSVYALATDITTVNATSNVYFMNEHSGGQYRVQFGDGTLGRKPITGNIVFLNSLVSEGTDTNGANTFSAASTVGGYSTVSVVTANSAIGGMDKETVESIKFNAPKNYEAQNRAVTTDDYKKLVEDNVAGLDTTIPVADATVLENPNTVFGAGEVPGVVYIDGERIEYNAVEGNNLLYCTRGTFGTSAKAHNSGATVVNSGAITRIPILDKFSHYGDNLRLAYNDSGTSLSAAGNSPEHAFIRNAGQGSI